MATVWTAERLQKLLLIIVDHINLPQKSIAELPEKWRLAFPSEAYQPTARAIREQIFSLKKTHQLKLKGGATVSEPSTPRAPRTLAGPSSGNKRKTPQTFSAGKGQSKKRVTGLDSNDNDNDDEEEAKYQPIAPRETPSRRSRSTPIDYRDDDDLIEIEDDEVNAVIKSEDGETIQPFKLRNAPQIESPLQFKSKSHKIFERMNLVDSVDNDTDTSEYQPFP